MIINNISNLRKKKNITQEKLADDLKVSRQTIIAIEDNSNNYNVSLELAFKISNYFNKDIEEIFKEKDMTNIINKKASTVDEIQAIYGNRTILIKGTLVYRCNTHRLEKNRKCLLNYDLPKFGKMKKFIVLNNEVYELIPTREYKDRNDLVKHVVGNKVDIDPSCIDFNQTPWNGK